MRIRIRPAEALLFSTRSESYCVTVTLLTFTLPSPAPVVSLPTPDSVAAERSVIVGQLVGITVWNVNVTDCVPQSLPE